MSFQSLDFLLQHAEEAQNKNESKKSSKIDLRTPFGLNDLMFDDNELCSYEQTITPKMARLQLENQNQTSADCSNITDYINKHLSLLSTEEPKFSSAENIKNIESKLPLSDKVVNNIICENKIVSKQCTPKQSTYIKKNKIFHTKPYSKVRKSPLEKQDSGLSLIMGRKYPKSTSNAMNNYLYNVLIDTRSRGFKFNTPSPDELVLSWMDIVRQMPNK